MAETEIKVTAGIPNLLQTGETVYSVNAGLPMGPVVTVIDFVANIVGASITPTNSVIYFDVPYVPPQPTDEAVVRVRGYPLGGDPRLILGVNGSRLNFVGGQPTMDQGLENMVLIALFTAPGWPGAVLFDDPQERPGSDFEAEAGKTITMNMLNRVRESAERALDYPVFGEVSVEVSNPVASRLDVYILIKPPGNDFSLLLLSKNGLNWEAQILDPASKRI